MLGPVERAVAAEPDRYAVESVSASLSSTQAGAHADLIAEFRLATREGLPYAETRDFSMHLPPGVIATPGSLPRCSPEQLGDTPEESACPLGSQVGTIDVELGATGGGLFHEPLYLMPKPGGDIEARLGFFAGPFSSVANIRLDPGDYGLIVSIEGAPSATLVGARTTLWGVPAAGAHDGDRLTPLEAWQQEAPPAGRGSGLPEAPFMSNPTDCSVQRAISVTATSYQRPLEPVSASAPFPRATGCSRLDFGAGAAFSLTTRATESPSGLDVRLDLLQNATPHGLATSALKSLAFDLAAGVALNPAAADGLQACSADQVGVGLGTQASCPDGSKLGTVDIDSPALAEVLHGSIYLRTPAPGSPFGFWMVVDEGPVRLKLPAEVEADPLSGALRVSVRGPSGLGGLPQLPLSRLEIHMFSGPRAVLVSPERCGAPEAGFTLEPWSGGPALQRAAVTAITEGCLTGGFSPTLEAGTTEIGAGRQSPFVFNLHLGAREANLRSLDVRLPSGLVAQLAGSTPCAAAAAVVGDCPAQSLIGAAQLAVGAGAQPLWLPAPGDAPAPVYLTEGTAPANPYGLAIVVPARAGPFDFGAVVIRAGIELDPASARTTLRMEPLPQIVSGIPVHYRELHLTLDRPHFIRNPTSCASSRIEATAGSVVGTTAILRRPFQVADCPSLRFKPRIAVGLSGGLARNGHPTVRVRIRGATGEAAISSATVTLPPGELLDLRNIHSLCPAESRSGRCPGSSRLGYVRLQSPLLPGALEGPIYLRTPSHGFPDLLADLHGDRVHLELHGHTGSAPGGRLRLRFAALPDLPLSRAAFTFTGGRNGIVVNSAGLCGRWLRVQALLRGQNGGEQRLRPHVQLSRGC